MKGFGQLTVPVTDSDAILARPVTNKEAVFAVLATLSVVLDKNGTVSVSKLKFVFAAFDVNPAAIIFVVVRVFDTTKFANG